MGYTHDQNLMYIWRLFEGGEIIGSGEFEARARFEFENAPQLVAGEIPVNVGVPVKFVKAYHISAQKKARFRAVSYLRDNGKYRSDGNWGAWQQDEKEHHRSVPLLIESKVAFVLQLEICVAIAGV